MVKAIKLYFLVLFSIGTAQLSGQSSMYVVTRSNGKEIGTVTTSAKQAGEQWTYNVHSDVNFKVLWKEYHRQTSNNVQYQNGYVKESFSCVYMNNELEDSSALNLSGAAYQGFRTPDIRFQLNSKVQFTTAKLYFQEPVNVDQIYSERFLAYCALEAQGNNKYKLHLPNGKVNYYTYKNHKLIEVLVERTWFDLRIKPSIKRNP